MARPKGLPKTGGRKKGTPNRLTKAIKEAVVEAFEKAGGVDYLLSVAREDPRTFCTLVGKAMPLQIEGTGENGEIVFKTVYEARPK